MSKVKYLYVRDHNKFPVGTFAYKIKEKHDGAVKLSYAFSAFYMKDTYNRAMARDLTRGRLENKPVTMYGRNAEEMLIAALNNTAGAGTNYWSSRQGKLGHRFLSACARTAGKLWEARQNSARKAA